MITDMCRKKCHILKCCTAGAKSCGCLNKVSTGLCHDFTHFYLFFFCQIAGFHNDLQNFIITDILHGMDFCLNIMKSLFLNPPKINHHIYFICAAI